MSRRHYEHCWSGKLPTPMPRSSNQLHTLRSSIARTPCPIRSAYKLFNRVTNIIRTAPFSGMNGNAKSCVFDLLKHFIQRVLQENHSSLPAKSSATTPRSRKSSAVEQHLFANFETLMAVHRQNQPHLNIIFGCRCLRLQHTPNPSPHHRSNS